jgi:2-haloacid dehalogenase
MGDRRPPPRALLFDVQGTATDFYSTVRGEAQRIAANRSPDVDWDGFVEAWRAGYSAALQAAARGPAGWVSVRAVYRDVLDRIAEQYGLGSLTDADRDQLSLAWEKLQVWTDVPAGLTRMKRRFTVATLSNADVAAIVNLSKHAGLQWDAIFTAEMARAFKPDPAVYRLAATYLGLPPAEIMMVASHKYDLRAAARLGCHSAFVARPLELGVGGAVDIAYEDEFDINASDFADLADQLGC